MNPKRVKRIDIEMIGRTAGEHPCPVCTDNADPFFTAASKQKHDRIGYKKLEIDSPEAQKHPHYNRIDSVPYVTKCVTYKSGRRKCHYIKGFRREDFHDLDRI
jgi:hypothetical protein